MITIKQVKGLSYMGAVQTSVAKPLAAVADMQTALEVCAKGYHVIVGETSGAPSAFARDPGNTGGAGCVVDFSGHTAVVSGEIELYPDDPQLGHRVGFAITAPEDLKDVSGATFAFDDKTGLVAEGRSGDPRVFWWFPLVEAGTTKKLLTIDWDGTGVRKPETFTVLYEDFSLQEPPEDEEQGGEDGGEGNGEGTPAALQLPENFESMTVAELKAFAEEHKIDLGGATAKDDIKAAIRAAVEQQ